MAAAGGCQAHQVLSSPRPITAAPSRRAYALPMGMLCGLSFVASLYFAHANPAAGYFMTLTRLHELGMGGLVSVWGADRALDLRADGLPIGNGSFGNRVPGQAWLCRTLAATVGLLVIGGSGFLYTPRLPFPGTAALVPVLGTVAVIVAGKGGAATHALTSGLGHPWLQYIGDISYSLYLTHWPVVVVYPFITGRSVDGYLADDDNKTFPGRTASDYFRMNS